MVFLTASKAGLANTEYRLQANMSGGMLANGDRQPMNRNVQPDLNTVENVRSLVTKCGVRRAAKHLDLSPPTVVRLLSGLAVNAETLRLAKALEGQTREE